MPLYGYAVVIAGWLVWMLAFVRARRTGGGPAKVVDRRARWGIVMVGLGYGVLWQGRFWDRPLPWWRLAISVCLLALASLLSWTATRALGRQWRIDAGLSADHELVTAGPYGVVRHPIYTSMMCMFFGTGIMLAPWWLLAAASVLFFAGTEIRVHVEERLLASHFGEKFEEYRRRVPAYIPLVR